MDNRFKQRGLDELRAIRRESRMYYWAVAVFSFFVNLLMLTGPCICCKCMIAFWAADPRRH